MQRFLTRRALGLNWNWCVWRCNWTLQTELFVIWTRGRLFYWQHPWRSCLFRFYDNCIHANMSAHLCQWLEPRTLLKWGMNNVVFISFFIIVINSSGFPAFKKKAQEYIQTHWICKSCFVALCRINSNITGGNNASVSTLWIKENQSIKRMRICQCYWFYRLNCFS